MSAFTCTSALCAALLVALSPGNADAAGALTPLPIAAWQRPWSALPRLELTPLQVASQLHVLPELTRPRLAVALDRDVTTSWSAPLPAVPLRLDLGHRTSTTTASPRGAILLGLSLPTEVPPLIRYTDESTHVTLSISPGSPCTGACLKLAGSF